MKIAIMQPYFFPYIGYFSLIKNTEYFVFFDTPQYIRKGWINRNRIIGANGEAAFFTVPIEKTRRETPINEVNISSHTDWRNKILGQLNIYKKAPYYKQVIELVKDVTSLQTSSISELAINSVVKTCEYLQMNIKYDVFSNLNLKLPEINAPDEWALYIAKELGYDTYINPPGGKSFFNRDKYLKENIDLQFLTQEIIAYNQKKEKFVPALSIIDVMMFCNTDEIQRMFHRYKIER